MPEYVIPVLMFVLLFIGVLSGFPLGFALGGIGLIVGLVIWGEGSFGLHVIRLWMLVGSGETPYVMSAGALFLIMGLFLERTGVTDTLYAAMHLWMGPFRGGLAIGTVIIATMLAACTGIIGASVVMMGLIGIPAMLKHGYDKELATGCVSAGGTLGILIPPSLMLVFYGPMAQLSVGKLFMAAFMPGFLLSALYITYIAVRCFFQPHLAPALPAEERRVPLTYKLRIGITAILPPVFLILAVLGSIFAGICPPTEAAAVGALGAMLLSIAYRKLTWQALYSAIKELMAIGGTFCIVFAGASMFTGVFIGIGGGRMVGDLLLGMEATVGRWGILVIMMFVVFLLGYVLDWIGIILIIVPVFTPVAIGLGFDPLWFALLVCINLQMCFLTPPMAPALFYLKAIVPEGVTMGHLMRGVIPFVVLQLVGLGLCMAFPQIVLWLPSQMIK
ncbi:TRAP transporter large permease subunit [Chloroflexota bacterium]